MKWLYEQIMFGAWSAQTFGESNYTSVFRQTERFVFCWLVNIKTNELEFVLTALYLLSLYIFIVLFFTYGILKNDIIDRFSI